MVSSVPQGVVRVCVRMNVCASVCVGTRMCVYVCVSVCRDTGELIGRMERGAREGKRVSGHVHYAHICWQLANKGIPSSLVQFKEGRKRTRNGNTIKRQRNKDGV